MTFHSSILGQKNYALSKQSFLDFQSNLDVSEDRGFKIKAQTSTYWLHAAHYGCGVNAGKQLLQFPHYLLFHCFVVVVFRSYLTFSFHSEKMNVGRRKDAEREKTGERKNGKREGFTGFRTLLV